MKAPLSLCIIARNDPVGLRRCLESARPHVAEICVVDTGSSDDTPAVAREFADKFEQWEGCNDADGKIADFGAARRRSFALASHDRVMWLDSDDELVGGEHLAELVAQLDRDDYLMLAYDYTQDAQGRSVCLHWRERVVDRRSFVWVGAVHEVLAPVGHGIACPACALEDDTLRVALASPPRQSRPVQVEQVRVVHHRQRLNKPADPERNLRILDRHLARHGDLSVRDLYYRGLELGYLGRLRESIATHKLYVSRSGWDDEKALSALEIARHYASLGEYAEARDWAGQALQVRETWVEPYLMLGRCWFFLAQAAQGVERRRNWERVVHWIRAGFALPPTRTILWVDPTERLAVHAYLHVALAELGDVRGALESCESAAELGDQGIIRAALTYRERLAKAAHQESVAELMRLGHMSVAAAKVSLDIVAGQYSVASSSVGDTDVIIYTGPALERWNPDTIERRGPMGGSELMAWQMARGLRARGHSVRLIGDCLGAEGTWDGVQFVSYQAAQSLRCRLLISSRQAEALDVIGHDRSWLWVHDITAGDSLTVERAQRLERIMVLSRWHEQAMMAAYPWIGDGGLTVTRNGIDLSLFARVDVPRKQARAIATSSPDRYLPMLLDLWPEIRRRVPEAEFHCYYGFANMRNAAQIRGSHDELAAIVELEQRVDAARELGVFMHGRVTQRELAEAFLSSGALIYPTWFSETSCISAMQARAAGCNVVTSPIAALPETLAGYKHATLIDAPYESGEYREAFVDAAVRALTQPAEADAEAFDIDSLVLQWDEMIRQEP